MWTDKLDELRALLLHGTRSTALDLPVLSGAPDGTLRLIGSLRGDTARARLIKDALPTFTWTRLVEHNGRVVWKGARGTLQLVLEDAEARRESVREEAL